MIRNVAIVSLSSGIMGEEEIQYEVEIGFVGCGNTVLT